MAFGNCRIKIPIKLLSNNRTGEYRDRVLEHKDAHTGLEDTATILELNVSKVSSSLLQEWLVSAFIVHLLSRVAPC